MLSILAQSFLVATQTDNRKIPEHRERALDEYWWKKIKRASHSCSK